jgi:hypothetical protein
MHFDPHFSAIQIFWTLTFAGLLILLVVLLGRDRVSRFPWFTASMVVMALRMLASRLLFGRMAPLTSSEIFLTLADINAVVSILVVVEMARRAFKGASRTAWIAGAAVMLAVAATVVVLWGPWPARQTVFARSTLADLRLMQLVAQKTDMIINFLLIELCVLVAFFGRRFHAGWRSHTQKIVIGLSTVSIAQLLVRFGLQELSKAPPPQTQQAYMHLMGLQEKLLNTNSVVFLAVLIWWIAWLWLDEPGTVSALPVELAGKPLTQGAGEAR